MNALQPPRDRMVFFVGRGRSGTTLLKLILDAHPAISVAPEGLFIMNLYSSYRSGGWDRIRFRRFARDLFREDAMRRWGLTSEELERRWSALDAPGFGDVCAAVHEAYADGAGKEEGRLLAVKAPHYTLAMAELMDAFPRAKFVHLVRDYRDNVLSYQHVPFDLSNAGALAYRWKRYHALALAAARRDPARVYELRFEDLVRAPEASVESLCRFLGVEADETMLRTHEHMTEAAPSWHRHLKRPIDPELAGRWRTSLPAGDVAACDAVCQPLGRRFGYEPASAPRWSARAFAGALYGAAVTAFERLLFRLPVAVQASIIGTYRRVTRKGN